MFDIPKYLTVAEVAKALNVSKMTIYRLIEGDQINHTKIGCSFRISENSLKDYIDENTSGISRPS